MGKDIMPKLAAKFHPNYNSAYHLFRIGRDFEFQDWYRLTQIKISDFKLLGQGPNKAVQGGSFSKIKLPCSAYTAIRIIRVQIQGKKCIVLEAQPFEIGNFDLGQIVAAIEQWPHLFLKSFNSGRPKIVAVIRTNSSNKY